MIDTRGLEGLVAGGRRCPGGRSRAPSGFEKAPGEPTVTLVEGEAADRLSETGCDAVVAIGGGSAMDTAKAARLVAGQGERYLRFAPRRGGLHAAGGSRSSASRPLPGPAGRYSAARSSPTIRPTPRPGSQARFCARSTPSSIPS